MVGHPAAVRRVPRPHRPHLDQHRRLSGRRPRAGARRDRTDSTPPQRCSSRTSPSEYPEAMLTELVELPGGSFRMGSTSFYPEEAPIHTARVGRVRDRAASGHQRAVRRIRRRHRLRHRRRAASSIPALYPGANPADLVPGALVFRPTSGPGRICATGGSGGSGDPARAGGIRSGRTAGSTIGSIIPSCRSPIPTRPPMPGGRDGGCRPRRNGSTRRAAAAPPPMPWGDDATPGGRLMANTWQGRFPYQNDGALGWAGHVAGRAPSRRTATAWST